MRFQFTNILLRPLLDILFPPRCVYCGRLGSYLCDDCWQLAVPVGDNICVRCGEPLTQRGLCHRCRTNPPEPIRGIRGVFFYSGPVAQAIQHLKYQGIKDIAPILAQPLVEYIDQHSLTIDGLVPVPLHPQRLAERGFNQSRLIAQHIAISTGIPIHADLIRRVRFTQPQARLGRSERMQNVSGAFAPDENASLHGETILLIDDVATTGATLRACAQALKQIGAGEIWALTVARAHSRIELDIDMPPADLFLMHDIGQNADSIDPAPPFI